MLQQKNWHTTRASIAASTVARATTSSTKHTTQATVQEERASSGLDVLASVAVAKKNEKINESNKIVLQKSTKEIKSSNDIAAEEVDIKEVDIDEALGDIKLGEISNQKKQHKKKTIESY